MHDALPTTVLDRIARVEKRNGRSIVAVAGPPGSGKSTLAEGLVSGLVARGAGAVLVPMDGFHYDDAVLEARGLRSVKGAPDTFDVQGLLSLVTRLRDNTEPDVAVPVFDRSLEISRNAARIVPQAADILVVEGNYLLLDTPGWWNLAPLFDITLALNVQPAVLRERLERRWRDLGFDEEEVRARVDGNDMPNGQIVIDQSRSADIVLSPGVQTLNNIQKYEEVT